MAGIVELDRLLADMEPVLLEPEYVFVSQADMTLGDALPLRPLASFQEQEGLSLVLERAAAENAGVGFDGSFRCITLTVHSSLEAVGLTAAVAKVLSERGVSANVIAAFHHDHVFVPSDKAALALAALKSL